MEKSELKQAHSMVRIRAVKIENSILIMCVVLI